MHENSIILYPPGFSVCFPRNKEKKIGGKEIEIFSIGQTPPSSSNPPTPLYFPTKADSPLNILNGLGCFVRLHRTKAWCSGMDPKLRAKEAPSLDWLWVWSSGGGFFFFLRPGELCMGNRGNPAFRLENPRRSLWPMPWNSVAKLNRAKLSWFWPPATRLQLASPGHMQRKNSIRLFSKGLVGRRNYVGIQRDMCVHTMKDRRCPPFSGFSRNRIIKTGESDKEEPHPTGLFSIYIYTSRLVECVDGALGC